MTQLPDVHKLAKAAGLSLSESEADSIALHLDGMQEHFSRIQNLQREASREELPACSERTAFAKPPSARAEPAALVKLFNGIEEGRVTVPRML